MAKINILSKDVAVLIAAGEVVERPSSAIKEMVENSIDAGASSITVEIKNGGTTYIRVTDNGMGIEKDDIKKVFISHATSKISSSDDLNSIGTLGFRGEAMASIAGVAKVEMLTKARGSDCAYRYVIHGGSEISFEEAGCPDGTTIVVRDLFFNTPARMKFLKKDVTEANAAQGVVDRIALSHPEISFRFIRDGKQTLLTNGDSNLKNTIYSVCPKDFSSNLLEADYELNSVTVKGFISSPYACRSNRSMQYFFVNGRLVQSKTCFAALEQSYKNSIMAGKFPACVLNIAVDTAMVDVNVHPAKIEVRFANEKQIFDGVYYACKSALESDTSRKEAHFTAEKQKDFFIKEKFEQTAFGKANAQNGGRLFTSNADETFIETDADTYNKQIADGNGLKTPKSYRYDNNWEGAPKSVDNPAETSVMMEVLNEVFPNAARRSDIHVSEVPEEIKPQSMAEEQNIGDENENSAQVSNAEADVFNAQLPDFRVIGEAFKTYIIAEVENQLYFIDKHAAHERILFEELKANQQLHSQVLLTPVTVNLSKEEYSALTDNLDLLRQSAFLVEDFGNSSVIVRECPQILSDIDVTDAILEIAGKLLDGKTDITGEKLDWIFHSTACRAAVKAGDITPRYEMERFVAQLLARDDIRYCPHGRPVMIKMTKYEVEKQFGRA